MFKNKWREFPYPKRFIELLILTATAFMLYLLLNTIFMTINLWGVKKQIQSSALQSDGSSAKLSETRNPELQSLFELYKSTGKLSLLDPDLMNNTFKAENEIIVFNRVPKVGSQSMNQILKTLSKRNDFWFHHDPDAKQATIVQDNEGQEKLAEMILELDSPCAFEKHVVFTNFSKFKLPTPIYIDLVRDPVERVISWFYYIRAPWYLMDRHRNHPEISFPATWWLHKDFETCVLSGDPECRYIEGENYLDMGKSQILFLCGHDEECGKFNTQPALDKAKYAVEKQYSVVGILEDMPTTLAVFEKYIPRFFAGATEIYNNEIKRFENHNKNNFKPTISEEVKNLIRQNFTKEIEFYKFCKHKLQSQFLAVNLEDFE